VKSRLFLAVFYALASFWALVVLNSTSAWPTWQAWGMAMLPAFLIGALGLRLYVSIRFKDFIRKCRNAPRVEATSGKDPLVPCQVGHRQPYFDRRVN
jgi:hypothetical protein